MRWRGILGIGNRGIPPFRLISIRLVMCDAIPYRAIVT